MSKVVLVTDNETCEGLYVNGKLVAEGKVVKMDVIMKYLTGKNKVYSVVETKGNWLAKAGKLPKTLDEVYKKGVLED